MTCKSRVSVACVTLVLLWVLGLAPSATANLTPLEELGKELFFDKISNNPNQSCASCHSEKAGWTGGVAGINLHGGVYRGAQPQRFGNRKPPTSAYAPFSPVFHFDDVNQEFVGGILWDGRATGERLGNPAADQALGPFLVPVEQNMPSMQAVCLEVQKSKYADLFEEVWGPGSLDCSDTGYEAMYDRIGLSIAAYEASEEVSPFSSKYDAYWEDCVGAGNSMEDCGKAEGNRAVLDPNGVLSDLEWDGLIEFGEYCSPCHVSHELGPNGEPPLFTDFTFENIGVPANAKNPFYRMDEIFLDDGTPINPNGDDFIDLGLGRFLRARPEWADRAEENDGKFRIPTLRNVDQRPGKGFPKAYMHNGVLKSLAEVVHFYNTRDVPEEGWPPPEVSENVNRDILEGVPLGNLELSQHAEDAIVAFLGTLNDGFTPSASAAGSPSQMLAGQALDQRGGILFRMPSSGSADIQIYDISGRRVRDLGTWVLARGDHRIEWDGRADSGRSVGSGIYFYRIRSLGRNQHVKAILIR